MSRKNILNGATIFGRLFIGIPIFSLDKQTRLE